MPAQTTHLSGDELYQALKRTGLEHLRSAVNGVYDTSDAETMVIAQRTLLDNGFVFTSCEMVEGHFYVFTFIGDQAVAPYWVKLRYITGGQTPAMTLMHRDEKSPSAKPFDARRITYGTHTSDGERLLFDFLDKHGPFSHHFWMPAFTNSPLLS